MQVKSSGSEDFKNLAAALKKAGTEGKTIRSNLTKRLQEELKPVVEDVQRAVESLEVKGTRGGGKAARARFDKAGQLRKESKARALGKTVRKSRRAPIATGLRARIAHGIKSRVRYSGFQYGAQIYVDTSALPQSQRTLPANLNRAKGWRHPVFGDRNTWVAQRGGPWFDQTIARHVSTMRAAVADAVNATFKQLGLRR